MNNLAVIIIDMQEKAIIDNKRELLSAQINLLDYAIKNNLNVYTFSISHAGKLIPELMPKLKKSKSEYFLKEKSSIFQGIILKETKKEKNYFYFEDLLKEKNISKLIISGTNKEVCIKYSVLDAINLGYSVLLSNDLMNNPDKSNFLFKEQSKIKHFNSHLDLIDYLKK
ncbi:isochorismatase family protein [archaeon]|nr:isochorismatase family protein [archaeon]